jgi:quinol-cytochrome oxidoreductase complex cytochrome b subunit
MDTLRRVFGLIWMLGAIAIAVALPYLAISKLVSTGAGQEDYVFWIVIVTIFIPIIIGFFLFGMYAYKGEYNHRHV